MENKRFLGYTVSINTYYLCTIVGVLSYCTLISGKHNETITVWRRIKYL